MALATDHRPVEGVPVYFFLVGTSANLHWGVLGTTTYSGLGFSLMLSTDPHTLQQLAAGQKCMHARVPLTFDHLTRGPCSSSRIGRLLASACSAHGSHHSRPTRTNTRLAASQTEKVPIVPDGFTKCEIRHGRIGSPLADGQIGRGMRIPWFPPARPLDYCISPGMDRSGQGFRGGEGVVL